ncbi:TetR/AcrR family transcriptional regulator [Nocardiopsis suaedae]|uniref:TetR family transcriptional regulator n=1 Tax=Nocardiopsis suaedae TaxID=3018444 RepID=A0ABT4TPQ2_9ACTN|nr:TetR/AcrR family transcriptional regulator [Nocardiopsis suaedae]MDA2806653.1 TetR family transcriptional regulator [Nocardiopsis suaedae]
MPRWEPGAAERLQASAFDLFEEKGFERTTVAEIARGAGLTPRTFFNHFTDKREVLFGLATRHRQEIIRRIAAGPDPHRPLDAVVHALKGAADTLFEHRRTAVLRREGIVGASPELRERELDKQAALTGAIAGALQDRGLDPEAARFAAGAGMLVQRAAVEKWTRPQEGRSLGELLDASLDALRATLER